MARERGAGVAEARAVHRELARRVRFLHFLQLSLLPRVARHACGARQGGARADGRARRGDRALDFRAALPVGPRGDVQFVRGTRAHHGRQPARGPGRGRRRRIGDSRAHAAVALPQEVQRQAPVRDLHRPHRREQGLRGALLVLRAVRGDASVRPRSRAGRVEGAADPGAPEDPARRLPLRRGQVRRARGRRRADHAVAVRELVDGRARGVGARQARARQRPLRRAARPVGAQQRRAVLRDVRGIRRGAVHARGDGPDRRDPRPQRPGVLPAALHVAGRSSGSTPRCSTG